MRNRTSLSGKSGPTVIEDKEEAISTLLDAANAWRAFIRKGDLMLEAAQEVAEQALLLQEAPDLRSSRANLSSKVKRVEKATNSAYRDFKEGREALYAFAKSQGVPTRRKSKKKPTVDIGRQTDRKLALGLQKQSDLLGKSLLEMLEKGATISRKLRAAAASISQGKTKRINVNALVNEGLDFRDHVSKSVFSGVNSILRRAKEVNRRAEEKAIFAKMSYEDREEIAGALRAAIEVLAGGAA